LRWGRRVREMGETVPPGPRLRDAHRHDEPRRDEPLRGQRGRSRRAGARLRILIMTEQRLTIPEGASAETERFDLTISGENGSATRRLWYPNVSVSVEADAVVRASDAEDAKTTATMSTFASHIQNAFHGVSEGWTYETDVFYSHFPMQVRVEDGDV